MRYERKTIEVISSLAVVALTVFTITVFIVYGYGTVFYVALLIALALALFNSWLVASSKERAPRRRRPRKR